MKNVTKMAKVKALMEQGMKAKQIHTETGYGMATIYNYMASLRKKAGNKKPTRKYTKRAKPTELTADQAKAIVQMQHDIDRYVQRISNLEVILSEKEKEVWTLECEVFDKKAIIAYLESKLIGGK